jgi:hypothetical protein
MIKKIKLMLLSLSSLFAVAVPLVATTSVSAQFTQSQINQQTCSGTGGDLTGGSAGQCSDKNESTFNKYATLIVNLLSVVVGFVAVVMIILGGFRYITSGGNSENVTKAKNTILYGIIGLVIVALAQVIVQFVLHKTDTGTTGV